MPDRRIRFVDTLIPLLVASVCAAGVVAASMLLLTPPVSATGPIRPFLVRPFLLTVVFLMWPLWLFSLAAEITLVVPLMIVVPILRRPPAWVAMIWGVGVGFAFAFLFGRILHAMPSQRGWASGAFFAMVGACAGLAYALTARWLLVGQHRDGRA